MSIKGKGKDGSGVSKLAPRPARSKATKSKSKSKVKGIKGSRATKATKVRHKTAEEMGYYRCVSCNTRVLPGKEEGCRILYKDRHLILCPKCKPNWTFYCGRGYLRMKDYQKVWDKQAKLTETVISLVGKSYVVDEIKFPLWAQGAGGGFLSFDIAVPIYNLLIDYHGEQHYKTNTKWNRSKASLAKQQTNDMLKYTLAPANGWTYMVFHYLEPIDNIEYVRHRIEGVLMTSGLEGGS